MDDIDLTSAEPSVAGPRSRAAGQGFSTDPDRAFLYRVLAIHARAGSPPAEAAPRIAGILASSGIDARGAAAVRLQGRLYGAQRLAAAFADAAEGAPETPVVDHLVRAGLVLTPEEQVAFAVPASCLDRLSLAAELFEAVAGFLRELGRP